MRVVMIGSGNVATIFSRLIKRSGHTLLQVISKQLSNAKTLATEFNCEYTDNYAAINKTADIYIIAINDDSLNTWDNPFNLGDKLAVHTAASVSKQVLQNISTNYGVLYPLQSLRKEMPDLVDIPLLIDGNSAHATKLIRDFALTISPIVSKADDEERLKLHIAAIIANNFTNHLFSLTEEFCKNEKVDFKLLLPIITETVRRLNTHSPATVQTGPAIRNDISTIDKHLALLANYPKLKNIYQLMTDSIRTNR
ncbi:MAG TPA: DUF2520 domain-containing protein [Ferruginibacter sp.]|jgi:hypothetical protein|nr:DUF2520 domain-containing protein [Ferruginibacter sp.]